MAKEPIVEDKERFTLRLAHLFWAIVIVLAVVLITFGRLVNQQEVNVKEIDKKNSKEMFNMHVGEQREQIKGINNNIKDGFNRIDKRLSDMAKE